MNHPPKLRPVEALPVEMEGERVICLRDNTGIARKVVAISLQAFFVAAHFDGRCTVDEIRDAYRGRFNMELPEEQIAGLISQLDDALMLESERFEAHRRQVCDAYRNAAARKAAHAGTAYPSEPEALRKFIDDFFEPPDGPGMPAHREGDGGVTAIAAPHIDMRRGGACYAHAYKELLERCPARTFVILGTLHQHADAPYIVTDKDFATPLGTMECDRDFTNELAHRAGLNFDEEIVHLNEHSIEFQAVFLRRFYGASRPVKIVPILCGHLLQAVGNAPNPMDELQVGRFLSALRELIQERGEDVAVIASVDLSHVGRRFGHEVVLNDEILQNVEQLDRSLLKQAENADANAFFEAHRRTGDRNHVCGASALHALLSVCDVRRGRLLKYGQAPEPATQSVVSFAAMAFEK